MHILLRERHGLEEAAAAEDLGQAPADLVVLSFADSDLSAFAAAWRGGRETLPSLRLANLRRLTHPLSVDLYLQKTLSGARGILIRLLGGIDYWRYGVEQVSGTGGRKGHRAGDHSRRRPARPAARRRLEPAALDAAPAEDAVRQRRRRCRTRGIGAARARRGLAGGAAGRARRIAPPRLLCSGQGRR